MSRLHQIQQRLSLTRKESTTILVLSFFLLLGTGLRYYQRHSGPDTEAYAEDMRQFRELSAAIVRESDSTNSRVQSSDSLSRSGARKVGPGVSPDSQITPGRSGSPSSAHPTIPINLNTATEEELISIPRIGPATARRILDFRQTYGPFHSIDELLEVRGIGEKTLEIMRPYMTVERASEEAESSRSSPSNVR